MDEQATPVVTAFWRGISQDVFRVLHKTILAETSYGLEVEEGDRYVTSTFTKLRRLVVLFRKFANCDEFEKHLKGEKANVKLIVDAEKGVLKYVLKDKILKGSYVMYIGMNMVLGSTEKE